MDARQQEIFDRLKKVLDDISKSPKTAAQVALLFEDFVASCEQIAIDLKETSDEETAAILKAIVDAATPI
ncbi:hypothetical protein ACFL6S_18050 [Candidatus Poribacteria bacterium]